jgi:hypothetical protein
MFHATHENGDLPSGYGLVKRRRIPQSIVQSTLCGGHRPLLLEKHCARNDPHGARRLFLVVLNINAWFTSRN